MDMKLLPAAYMAKDLSREIMTASFDIKNEWFFFDGASKHFANLQVGVNAWSTENFVAVYNDEVVAYFEGTWFRPLDIVNDFRTISFNDKCPRLFAVAFMCYVEHVFVNRGCKVLNWSVALQNERAAKQSERFAKDYCGHCVGIRHHSQKSLTGKVSKSALYEITQEEFFDWRQRRFGRRVSVHR